MIIAESRIVALELGYDYISTVHFFLTDCKLNNKYRIKEFVFKTDEEFKIFYESNRIGNSNVQMQLDSLPLTIEAENTISKAFLLWNDHHYTDDHIYPYHLFLAASQLKDSLFYSIIDPNQGLQNSLEAYYIEIGQLKKANIHRSIFGKLSKKIFFKS